MGLLPGSLRQSARKAGELAHEAKNTTERSYMQIAADIRKHWRQKDGSTNIYFGAVPYIEALESGVMDATDRYFEESNKSIVAYFLSNASTFRGEEAKKLKAELKAKVGLK